MHDRRKTRPSGRDSDPRRTIPLQSARWQKLRRWVLDRDPLCHTCLDHDRITEATDVDHRSGDPSDNSFGNLQPLCHSCHSRKTMQERNGSTARGFDASGWPTDPASHWNQRRTRSVRQD